MSTIQGLSICMFVLFPAIVCQQYVIPSPILYVSPVLNYCNNYGYGNNGGVCIGHSAYIINCVGPRVQGSDNNFTNYANSILTEVKNSVNHTCVDTGDDAGIRLVPNDVLP